MYQPLVSNGEKIASPLSVILISSPKRQPLDLAATPLFIIKATFKSTKTTTLNIFPTDLNKSTYLHNLLHICSFVLLHGNIDSFVYILLTILAGQIQITEDLSGHTTVGYDVYITVADARNTVGPKILTITVAGKSEHEYFANCHDFMDLHVIFCIAKCFLSSIVMLLVTIRLPE
jgi:hypothetical protein